MGGNLLRALSIAVCIFPCFESLAQEYEGPDKIDKDKVYFEQKLGVAIPEARFKDENGATVQLSELLRVRPTILVFAYYQCPNLCTLVLNGLSESIHKMALVFGQDYQVVSVSISPKEKPPLAQAKMRSYLARLGATLASYRGLSPWHFLTGDAAEILRLTSAVGFHFKYDPGSQEYSHPSGIIVVTPKGKVSRYFFGIQFPEKELASALKNAESERTGSLASQILLYCFHYDPRNGRYGTQILWGVRVVAVACALLMALLIGVKRESIP